MLAAAKQVRAGKVLGDEPAAHCTWKSIDRGKQTQQLPSVSLEGTARPVGSSQPHGAGCCCVQAQR